MNTKTQQRLLPLGLCLLLFPLGCSEGALADTRDILYLTPANAHKVEAGAVPDVRPEFADDEAQNYREVREQFTRRAGELLERSDVVSQLENIEQVFYFSGHYLDLVRIYQDHIEAFGVDNIAGPSLVFAYVQLGQDRLAQNLIDRLIAETPDAPLTWVVAGRYYLQNANESTLAARRARDAFQRALALDPNLPAFRGMNAAILRQQINALNRQLPADGSAAMPATAPVSSAAVGVAEAIAETDAVEEPAALEAVEEPPAVEDIKATEEPTAVEAPQSAAYHVALGRAELQQGSSRLEAAQTHFRQALALEADNLDAAIGLLLVAGRSGAPDEMITTQIRRIEEHPALTARQAYELALFTLRNLNDRALANMLLTRVQQLDPQFARRVDIDALMRR